jgi:hypothetical protein
MTRSSSTSSSGRTRTARISRCISKKSSRY